jgi:glycine hydroxymethyltransferase
MRKPQVARIADLVATAVRSDPASAGGRSALGDVADEVAALVAEYPAYPQAGVAAVAQFA